MAKQRWEGREKKREGQVRRTGTEVLEPAVLIAPAQDVVVCVDRDVGGDENHLSMHAGMPSLFPASAVAALTGGVPLAASGAFRRR